MRCATGAKPLPSHMVPPRGGDREMSAAPLHPARPPPGSGDLVLFPGASIVPPVPRASRSSSSPLRGCGRSTWTRSSPAADQTRRPTPKRTDLPSCPGPRLHREDCRRENGDSPRGSGIGRTSSQSAVCRYHAHRVTARGCGTPSSTGVNGSPPSCTARPTAEPRPGGRPGRHGARAPVRRPARAARPHRDPARPGLDDDVPGPAQHQRLVAVDLARAAAPPRGRPARRRRRRGPAGRARRRRRAPAPPRPAAAPTPAPPPTVRAGR